MNTVTQSCDYPVEDSRFKYKTTIYFDQVNEDDCSVRLWGVV